MSDRILYWITESGNCVDVSFWTHGDAAREILSISHPSDDREFYTEEALDRGWIYVESRDDEFRAGWYRPSYESLGGLCRLIEATTGIKKFIIQKLPHTSKLSATEAIRRYRKTLATNLNEAYDPDLEPDTILSHARPEEIKKLSRRVYDGLLRLVQYKDGSLNVGSAYRFTHRDIAPATGVWQCYGYVRANNGKFTYKTYQPHSMLDGPAIPELERSGFIKNHFA